MTRWGKKNPMNPSFWKDIGTFIIISSRSLCKDFKVLCLFMCMCVYACECSVHRHQKGCHFQIEWQLWANPPTAGAWLESSVRATYALNGLAIFLACKHVILLCIYLWVRVLAYHSLCVKVRGQLSVLSFHHELQALNWGHWVHGKRVHLLSHRAGPGHKHLNDHFNDGKKKLMNEVPV